MAEKHEEFFKQGSTIFKEGAVEDSMYFIKSGRVEILKQAGKRQRIIDVLETGQFFGEMGLVNRSPRSATAVAVADTQTFRMNRDSFLDLVKTNGSVALRIIDTLCLRLRDAHEEIKRFIQQNRNALVYDALSKMIQSAPDQCALRDTASAIAEQLGLAQDDVEKSIKKLIMVNLFSLDGEKICLCQEEAPEQIKALLEGSSRQGPSAG